ncbi:hypothetical protein ABZP36_007458 [Zizania latifolia]
MHMHAHVAKANCGAMAQVRAVTLGRESWKGNCRLAIGRVAGFVCREFGTACTRTPLGRTAQTCHHLRRVCVYSN